MDIINKSTLQLDFIHFLLFVRNVGSRTYTSASFQQKKKEKKNEISQSSKVSKL